MDDLVLTDVDSLKETFPFMSLRILGKLMTYSGDQSVKTDGFYRAHILQSVRGKNQHTIRLGFDYDVMTSVRLHGDSPIHIVIRSMKTGTSTDHYEYHIDYDGTTIDRIPNVFLQQSVITITSSQRFELTYVGVVIFPHVLSKLDRRDVMLICGTKYQVMYGHAFVHKEHVMELLEDLVHSDVARHVLTPYLY